MCKRGLLTLLIFVATGPIGRAQVVSGWRRSVTGMLGRPPRDVSLLELQRLERYLYFAAPGCGMLAATDYSANQATVRSMGTYLGNIAATATDPEISAVSRRLVAAFPLFPCAFQGKQLPAEDPPPPKPGDPPFVLKAPGLDQVPDADQEKAADLQIRYDTDAARIAVTWKNAEVLRQSLTAKGMSLNTQTAAAVSRLGTLFDAAADSLRAHMWDDALSNLQAVEATAQKVATVVGR